MRSGDNKSLIGLLSGAIIGESVISHPLTGNIGNDLLGSLSGLIFAAAVTLVLKWRMKKIKSLNPSVKAAGLAAVVIFSVFSFVVCVMRFSQYAARVMLDISSVTFPLLSFCFLAVFAAIKGKTVLLKLSAVLIFLSTVMIAITFALSVPFIETKYLFIYRAPEIKGFLYSFFSTGGRVLLVALPMLYIGRKSKPSRFVWGFLIGVGGIAVSLINTLGIFGAEFAATLSFPYSYAVSTASVGKIFSRMDVFLYCVCFFTCLIKCSVCIYSILEVLKKHPFKILFRKN